MNKRKEEIKKRTREPEGIKAEGIEAEGIKT